MTNITGDLTYSFNSNCQTAAAHENTAACKPGSINVSKRRDTNF